MGQPVTPKANVSQSSSISTSTPSTTGTTTTAISSTTTAISSTTAAVITTRRVAGLLAIDGIGEARFGEPASRVIPQLVAIFGPAVDDSVDSCGRRILHFVGIRAKFQDPDQPTRKLADPPFGSYEVLKSELSPENSAHLRTELGIGIGSTQAELEQKYPNALNNGALYVIRSDRGIVQLVLGADDRITAHVAQSPINIGCGD
jgi:hypothetical protein